MAAAARQNEHSVTRRQHVCVLELAGLLEAAHGRDHDSRWHAELLQGLGLGPACCPQSRLPLSGDDRDTQMLFFLQHGYRVIAHDRRGHGRSTQTSDAPAGSRAGQYSRSLAWRLRSGRPLDH